MTNIETGTTQTTHAERFNTYMGTDGETYQIPKPEYAAEYAQEGLRRMAKNAAHTRAVMDGKPEESPYFRQNS